MNSSRTILATTMTLLLGVQGCGVETANIPARVEAVATPALAYAVQTENSQAVTKHKVRFYHPANKTGGVETQTLHQVSTSDDATLKSAYYMDVPSVYCGENLCKIDIVRLHWDWLGRYTRFSLQPPTELEKGNAEAFSQEDYQKLQAVLSNPTSGLAELGKHELIISGAGGERVDGLSGATVSIRNSDYVEGAIWTCYTLWHFAHGELTGQIRNLSGDTASEDQLFNLLVSGDDAEAAFVLQQITRKGINSQHAIHLVSQQLQQHKSALYDEIFDYLSQLPVEQGLLALGEFAVTEDSKLRLHLIAHLQKVGALPDNTLLLSLSRSATQWNSFDEINRLLKLLQHHAMNDQEINHAISALLQHKNFVIARKAYWYLSDAPEATVNQNILAEFREKNSERI